MAACWAGPVTAWAQASPALKVWVHAGPGPEREAYVRAVEAFNQDAAVRQGGVLVELQTQQEAGYAAAVEQAAKSKTLPCVLEFDGPHVTAYAAAGHLLALDGFPGLMRVRDSMLGSLVKQGTMGGHLYSVGQYDSGLALWGNRELLNRVGARIPSKLGDGWTREELDEVLKRLKAAGVPTPLDMKFNYGVGEWLSYGIAPIMQSMGGDLMDRRDLHTVRGVLNSPSNVRALTLVQGWVHAGYVDAAPKDDKAFAEGRAALSWVGHWAYKDYKAALGDKLVLMPVPKFGLRPVTGSGSWNFGIAKTCAHPALAASFLEHLMSRAEISRVTAANGAIPGTGPALVFNSYYAPQGELRLYAEQLLSNQAVVRPQSPDYQIVSAAFAKAVAAIVHGVDVQSSLDRAVNEIDNHPARSPSK